MPTPTVARLIRCRLARRAAAFGWVCALLFPIALLCPTATQAATVPFAYVLEIGPSTSLGVEELNTSTNKIVARVPIPGQPESVAIRPNGAFAYVTYADFVPGHWTGGVAVVRTSTNRLVANIRLGEGVPGAVAFAPSGKYAYVTDDYDSRAPRCNCNVDGSDATLKVIKTSTRSVISTVPVGYGPTAVAITPDGRFAYVTSYKGDLAALTVVNTTTNRVSRVIPPVSPSGLLISPGGIAISPNGATAFVSSEEGLTSISTTTKRRIARIFSVPLGVNARLSSTQIVIAPNGRYAYMPIEEYHDEGIAVVDLATFRVIRIIAVGEPADLSNVAITSDGKFLYVTNYVTGTIEQISTAKHEVTATTQGGAEMGALAITPSAPTCGRTLLEKLKCGNESMVELKTDVACGASVAAWASEPLKLFRDGKTLAKIIQATRRIDLRKVKPDLRSAYRMYRDMVEELARMRTMYGPAVGNLVKAMDRANTRWDALFASFAWARLVADDLGPARAGRFAVDFDAFVRTFADVADVGDCVDLVLGLENAWQ